MAITDYGVGMLADLVKSVRGAAEKYRKYYIGRVNRENVATLESLLSLLYDGKEEELAVDFPKVLFLNQEAWEFGGRERVLCLVFLLQGLKQYGEDAASGLPEFIREISSGKYGMDDLPYPE